MPVVRPESFSPRAKLKLRFILVLNLLLKVAMIAIIIGAVARPDVEELAAVPAWTFAAAFVILACAMVRLVIAYTGLYYRAAEEVRKRQREDGRDERRSE